MVKMNRLTQSKSAQPNNQATATCQTGRNEPANLKGLNAHVDAENNSPNASLRTNAKKIKKVGSA